MSYQDYNRHWDKQGRRQPMAQGVGQVNIMEDEKNINLTHILQKHRLAISLAVIKTKPENMTLEEHIQQLRSKMNEDMDVDNVSVRSDDFLIDETNDFEMIVEENNDNDRNDNIFAGLNDKNDHCTETMVKVMNKQAEITSIDQNNDKINIESRNEENYIFDNQNETNDVEMINTQNLNDSITILENFDFGNEFDEINTVTEERSCLDEVMEMLLETGDNMTTVDKAVSNKIPSKSTQENLLTQLSEEIDVTQCFTDIDATQCESLDILATVDEDVLSQKYSYNKFGDNQTLKKKNASQKKDKDAQLVVDLEGTKVNNLQYTNNAVECHTSTSNTEINSQTNLNKINYDFEKRLNDTVSMTSCNLKSYRHTKEFKDIYKNVADIFNSNKNNSEDVKAKNSDIHLDKFKDVQKNSQNILKDDITEDYTSKTHYSQSQITDLISIEDKYIYGVKRNVALPNKGVNERKEKKKDVKDKKKKKQKEDIVILEDDLINNSKKEVTKTKYISNGNDISLPEIKSANISTKKNISQNLQNQTKSNETILQESLMTDFIAPTNSSQMFNQNNETAFEDIQDNDAISDVHANEFTLNADNKTLTVQVNRLYANYRLPHVKDSILLANDSTINVSEKMLTVTDSRVHANYSLSNAMHANDNTLTIDGNMLFATDTLANVNNSMRNANDNIFNTNDSNQNAKNEFKHLDKDLFLQESQQTHIISHATDAFPNNYISDDRFAYSQHFGNFGIENCRVPNNKTSQSEICPVFNNTFKETDQLRTTDFDNSQNIQASLNVSSHNNKNSENTSNIEYQKSCINFENNFNSMEVSELVNTTKIDGHKNMPITENWTNSDDNLGIQELPDSELEIIPFKIIEELNKVKMFLNKRHEKNLSAKGCSSETGYRSDSSSRNSLKLSQSLSSGLDQSAHSLFNHITETPLMVSTQDITEEISLVLGQLIDKLHVEEKYPSFLEDMLQSIQRMLGLIYQQNGDENTEQTGSTSFQIKKESSKSIHPVESSELTNNEESIHRIVLLNESIHLQKYTIEKITEILENFHAAMTSNESFEIQNIEQIENICYIFHLLEIILQKYNKTYQNLSQSSQNLSQNTQNLSQNSQDEKSLKKSHITDIWRKKWNPNYKESQNEGSQEKKCVISNCTTVLNKLIVGCMEGYSLVSYFALKCFNVMQN